MSAKDTTRNRKIFIQTTLCGDYRLILNKVLEKKLVTTREYNNLKSICKEDVEGHVVELVDKILNKGEDTCQAFLSLLQTDEDLQTTFPELRNFTLPKNTIKAPCSEHVLPASKKKEDEQYPITSCPAGVCLIINNLNFQDGTTRTGSDRDAHCLAEVFSWLGFRVLMCEDQTKQQMEDTLEFFSSLNDASKPQDLNVKEFRDGAFVVPQDAPNHGDVFVCCVLSHGAEGVVCGVDFQTVPIKDITTTFKARDRSPLTGRPKVFLIQACQGSLPHRGVPLPEHLTDDSQTIPEEADILVAVATVEDHKAMRHKTDGSWFIQSVCRHLKEGCPRGEDMVTILHRVNGQVGRKEASQTAGESKQMPEVRFTLRKTLVLSPQHN
ncbi:caspase-8-like isoform X2 [Entelurus aequoreus]|nr:caspase-8-like isoform X2 [Entelurus aequoreus]XP_061926237.1 caspase-8-like isoform X2 [Entelurus aequoreus]XP_061926238.1 caspase-8-like isoform X2 [Entelurus aequoreus]XP_061926239.1 caspase-8-like isoform X2 [Entelurus aequoreus]XP_061926240.1 caspase-8-like isoform X2 [Entelurus aequoreus]XP_061926242.1 caspase-8-like isoform X2 [Entelurus aequoreus]XP_061926243.1 caspase-8-like isoform X2 [Entelurus aequoreus]